mmetsp:Transcript_53286/g.161807  ORF Transcript_53286/g.161807 Transcript_53286/m.161807 type:complete len:361 (+) Transcript_53286:1472-2554(+)
MRKSCITMTPLSDSLTLWRQPQALQHNPRKRADCKAMKRHAMTMLKAKDRRYGKTTPTFWMTSCTNTLSQQKIAPKPRPPLKHVVKVFLRSVRALTFEWAPRGASASALPADPCGCSATASCAAADAWCVATASAMRSFILADVSSESKSLRTRAACSCDRPSNDHSTWEDRVPAASPVPAVSVTFMGQGGGRPESSDSTLATISSASAGRSPGWTSFVTTVARSKNGLGSAASATLPILAGGATTGAWLAMIGWEPVLVLVLVLVVEVDVLLVVVEDDLVVVDVVEAVVVVVDEVVIDVDVLEDVVVKEDVVDEVVDDLDDVLVVVVVVDDVVVRQSGGVPTKLPTGEQEYVDDVPIKS